MDKPILIIFLILLFVSFASLFIGVLMASSSVNKSWAEKHNASNLEILQVPHIFLKHCYEPKKYYVHKMVVFGTVGLFIGFASLYLFNKFGLV